MTSTEIVKQIKDYVLAGNKNPQVIETLLLSYKDAVIDEIPPVAPPKG